PPRSSTVYTPSYYISSFFLYSSPPHRDLHSFPTRRSSDLDRPLPLSFAQERLWWLEQLHPGAALYNVTLQARLPATDPALVAARSEEHTSELQSRFDLVCRLLLEKKKKKKMHHHNARI